MKHADLIWVQDLARRSLGKPAPAHLTLQVTKESIHLFLEELSGLMLEFATTFNELVKRERPEACFSIFRLGNPRPGLMLLRGKDKLVVAAEGACVRARIVQVNAYNERNLDSLTFEARTTVEGELIWFCVEDGQMVSPELVAKTYLSQFLVHGCRAFEAGSAAHPKMKSHYNSTGMVEF